MFRIPLAFLKKTAVNILSHRVLVPKSGRVVFCFHDVSSPDSPQYSELYSTKPETLREQVKFLRRNFDVIGLDSLLESPPKGRRLAAITFDDGFLSVKTTAMPILESLGVPFSIFVNKTAIEQNYLPYDRYPEINRRYRERVFLSKEDVLLMDRRGVLIGSHTLNHAVLSECDNMTLRQEIAENKAYLEGLIGHPVTHFAIPYGKREHYDARTLGVCLELGHKFVYSTNPTHFARRLQRPLPNPIPRIPVKNETAAELCFYLNRPMFKTIEI